MRAVAMITLPDGRLCSATERGTFEDDTNAWVPRDDGMTVTVCTTGEELTPKDLNTEVTTEGRSWYLHEWISAHATWQMEYEED
jgi:hypothetical protein